MPAQDWDPQLYQSTHAFVWEMGRELIDLLAPGVDETILDIGCGTGQLTSDIAQRCARVIGLDASADMIAQARINHPQLDFRVGDATDFALDAPVDAIFSNAALHWIQPPEKAVACMARALRPGGRMVAEFGGRGNVETILQALESVLSELDIQPAPPVRIWYYPSVAEYSTLLEKHGLEVRSAMLFGRPTPLQNGESGLIHWLRMFYSTPLSRLSSDQQDQFFKQMLVRVRPKLWRDNCLWADYRRLRIVAYKGTF